MTGGGRVVVEHGPGGRPALFRAPRRILRARIPEEVGPTLAALDAAREAGAWVAGWIGYEAGAAFEPRLRRIARDQGRLLLIGVFDAPEPFVGGPEPGPVALTRPEPMVGRADYDRAIGRVLDYIAAGDCYQVNLTFPLAARLAGDPFDLYRRLRGDQPVGHGAFVDLDGDPAVVSLSPELFLRVSRGGRIETRPMKGTAPRDPDPDRDAALARELRESVKAQAENLMIVDLLRNDIARVSRPGSVHVPALYAIEPYATVHQMTSTVAGDLAKPASLSRLMPALFPCGSVTGAPKIRAMQIIRELEPNSRGVYCGAIGWMAPDGTCDFSVAIRTLTVRGREVTLNVGGGVVADSTAQGEWEEALWKTRFLGPVIAGG
jgi:para-aminobenzoate synthetase component 1